LTASPHRVTLQENEGGTLRQSELNTILEDHILWLGSDGKQGKRADLQGANLEDASLVDVNLQGANLQGANLHGANLQGANLRGADLEGAYLHGANLHGTSLEDANLERVNLYGANLYGANLYGANLLDASLEGAKFTTNFKKVGWFECATFSEDQIPWVVLHSKYPACAHTIEWVKAKADAA